MKKYFFKIMLIIIVFHALAFDTKSLHAHSNELQKGILITSAVVVGTGATYLIGRGCSALFYALAKRRYEPEMELLQRMVWKESVLEEELVPYVLEQHAKMNQSFFYYPGVYKNYPLLKYKNDLQSYINYLWFLQFFRLGTIPREEISKFIDKLQIILRYIVTDYRFIKEQRQFDESHR